MSGLALHRLFEEPEPISPERIAKRELIVKIWRERGNLPANCDLVLSDDEWALYEALIDARVEANARLIAAAPLTIQALADLRDEVRDWQEALGDERPSLTVVCARADEALKAAGMVE